MITHVSNVTTARVAQLRAMPYGEYLRTPEWQHTRKEQLRKVGYSCQIGGNSESCRNQPLHVHHSTYERLGNEKFVDLLVVCQFHHRLIHEHSSIAGTRQLPALSPQARVAPPGAPPPVTLGEDQLGTLARLVADEQRSRQGQASRSHPSWRLPALGGGILALIAVGALVIAQPWSGSNPGAHSTGANKYDCSDVTYAEAQRILKADSTDPNHLDVNRDGEACDSKGPR